MICKKCGHKLPEGTTECWKCGTRQEVAEQSASNDQALSKSKRTNLVIGLVAFVVVCACIASGLIWKASSDSKVELQVFAANSLSGAMAEAQELYTQTHPSVSFADTQFKSSGELNSMLAAGAVADVEITASLDTMDVAEQEGYIDPSSRITLFTNDLVIVAPIDSDIASVCLDDIATGEYTLCVGDDSVPVGNYANQALSTVGCFNDPEGKTGPESAGKSNGTDAYKGTPIAGKVALEASAGNICKAVESHATQLAIVYGSDVERFGDVKIVGAIPSDAYEKIAYPAAVCSSSKNAQAAQDFLNWCKSDPGAKTIWQKWGLEAA